jgi:hypothetical protein
MKVKWNLFAEGECEEGEIGTTILPGETKRYLYILAPCKACGNEMWIRWGFNVCERCMP